LRFYAFACDYQADSSAFNPKDSQTIRQLERPPKWRIRQQLKIKSVVDKPRMELRNRSGREDTLRLTRPPHRLSHPAQNLIPAFGQAEWTPRHAPQGLPSARTVVDPAIRNGGSPLSCLHHPASCIFRLVLLDQPSFFPK